MFISRSTSLRGTTFLDFLLSSGSGFVLKVRIDFSFWQKRWYFGTRGRAFVSDAHVLCMVVESCRFEILFAGSIFSLERIGEGGRVGKNALKLSIGSHAGRVCLFASTRWYRGFSFGLACECRKSNARIWYSWHRFLSFAMLYHFSFRLLESGLDVGLRF